VILDFTQLVQGPFATQILGDMGADILKVEPIHGDWMRRFSLLNLYKGGESVSFIGFNRNKRSIAVNLKAPEGLDVIRELVRRADVVIENFRPGVMDRLGIGCETLRAINPRLIYVASSGYGQTGPYVTRPGQDLLIQSMSGMATLTGLKHEIPSVSIAGIADLTTSLHIVYATCAALFSRERTGQGQRIDANLYSSMLTMNSQEIVNYLNSGVMPERPEKGWPNPYLGAPYGIYHTADGYVAIAMNPINKVAPLLGVEGYEHISSNNEFTLEDEITEKFSAAFRTRTTQEWLTILLDADVWCAPVYSFADLEKDPQIAENGMIIEFEHPTAGTFRAMGLPVKFDGTPGGIRYPAPLLGQHSEMILREYAGLDDARIGALLESGVVINRAASNG
jgi:crotonobetainyl-CoA:carnitine CoA-transferase CaiB-like acyl-CoA transferase